MPSAKAYELKLLSGTARPSRKPVPNAPESRLAAVPPPPAYLSRDAVKEWRRIAALAFDVGTLGAADLRSLALLAETLADIGKLRKVINSEGMTVEGGNGGRKGHPALAALTSARQQAHSMLTSFGLNPRGRLGMALPQPTETDNPFDQF